MCLRAALRAGVAAGIISFVALYYINFKICLDLDSVEKNATA
jgi:hypothetical protein